MKVPVIVEVFIGLYHENVGNVCSEILSFIVIGVVKRFNLEYVKLNGIVLLVVIMFAVLLYRTISFGEFMFRLLFAV